MAVQCLFQPLALLAVGKPGIQGVSGQYGELCVHGGTRDAHVGTVYRWKIHFIVIPLCSMVWGCFFPNEENLLNIQYQYIIAYIICIIIITLYGVSRPQMSIVWREYYCLWHGLKDVCYQKNVHRMAWLGSGCTWYGVKIIALGEVFGIIATKMLHAV